jgi:hypothetical protein
VAQAFINIEDVSRRDGLGKGRKDGLSGGQAQVEFVRPDHGAYVGAVPACGAFLFINIAGLFQNPYIEVAHIALNVHDLAQGVEFDSRMSTDIRHFRTEYSDGTVHGGEGLIQLGHGAAYRGPFFH